VAASAGNNRTIHPVFRIRDDRRSDPDIPIVHDDAYNLPTAGEVRNTVRAEGLVGGDRLITDTAADDVTIADVPVTVKAAKTWAGGPLGVPDPDTPGDQYPVGRIRISGENTTPAKIDRLVITEPSGGTNPFDSFTLTDFVSITDPAGVGRTGVIITVQYADGSQRDYTRPAALALAATDLADVVGFTATYTGRIDAGAKPAIVVDAQLRTALRSDPTVTPNPGDAVGNSVGVEAADLVDYPNVDTRTATDVATAQMQLQAQGIGVTAGKTISPDHQTEPDNSPVTVTLTGQPSGPSRSNTLILQEVSPTFFNQYDLTARSDARFTAPIDRVQVDALVGGSRSVDGSGNPVVTGAHWETGSATAGPGRSVRCAP
jgi:hypothetical protein